MAVSSSEKNRKNSNSEHQILAQERLNIRLTAQIKAWVTAQVELHTQLANEEATGILNRRFADRGSESGIKTRIFGVEESALSEINYLNENNDGNYHQNIGITIKNDHENDRLANIEGDDVSYISRKEKRKEIVKSSFSIENSMANSTLNFPMSPFQELVRGSCDSPRVTRNLFQGPEKTEICKEENNLNSAFLTGINLGDKIIPGTPENLVKSVKKIEIPLSPQYSQLLLVENNNDNNDASLLSECFRGDFLSTLLNTETVQNTVFTSYPLITKKDILIPENQIILDKDIVGNIIQFKNKILENQKNTTHTEILNPKSYENHENSHGKNKNEISLLLENENNLKFDLSNVSVMTYVKNSIDVSTDDILSPLQKRLIAKSVEKKIQNNTEKNISSPVSVPYNVTYALLCGEKTDEIKIESEKNCGEKLNNLQMKNSSSESLTRTYVEADSTVISTDNKINNNNISNSNSNINDISRSIVPHSPSPLSTIKIPNTEGKIFEKLLSRKIIPLIEKSPPKIQVLAPHVPYRPVRDYLDSEFPLLFNTDNVGNENGNENEIMTQTQHTTSLPLPLSNTSLYHPTHDKENVKELTENQIPVLQNTKDYGNNINEFLPISNKVTQININENKNENNNKNKNENKYKNGSVNTEISSGNNDYSSVFERESYLIPPVGLSMRAVSRERGGSVAVSLTQNKSSQLQAKLRYGHTVRVPSLKKILSLEILKLILLSYLVQIELS